MQDADQLILFADWVLPMSGPPIKNGAVVIENALIKQVLSQHDYLAGLPINQRNRAKMQARDYGEAVILPGLINLHTHLDISSLRCFDTESGLFTWINQLMDQRASWTAKDWWRSTLIGAAESAMSGSSTVVDSSYSGMSLHALARLGMRGVVGVELFGLRADECEVGWKSWLERFEKLAACEEQASRTSLDEGTIKLTVAPHAPYTVGPELWRRASEWAGERNVPILGHLSESRNEVDWIASEDAAIDRFHRYIRTARGADKVFDEDQQISWKGKGLTPTQHLDAHGALGANLIAAHAVHTSGQDLEILAKHGCKIAHCPRSNSRLRVGRAPLSRWQKHGLVFGIGTDSLASCDDLSVLEEARYAFNLHRAAEPEINFSAESAIRAITIDAARALQMDHTIGTLAPGKRADIAVFEVAESAADNPYSSLLLGSPILLDLIVNGSFVVEDGDLCRREEAEETLNVV